ncbi:MAG: glutamate-cysteine ligase family protein [Bacteroidota bacterium]
MGDHNVARLQDDAALRRFTRQLIEDVRALEHMLDQQMFETGITRIGAEQELFLVDHQWQPAPIAEEVLATNTEERLVSELTRFNLEFNMNPRVFEGTCLSEMEQELNELLDHTRALAQGAGGDIAMVGILPTIHLSDLSMDNMMPKPRYYALNDTICNLRGGPAQFQIRGMDELFVKHDSIMLEGCNTSFQTHFQVSPHEFAKYYNIAQAVAGPVLAAAVNSPVLFGKRLWQETRIALFEQAVDTRSSNLYLREMSPRVHFGSEWMRESVMELFREDIARFRVLLGAEDRLDDPFDVLQAGGIPKLRALMLHNGTVYRWNRACYGISDTGKPHLRIENRVLPSGPTAVDEVANAALWFGLVSGLAMTYDDITQHMDFDHAKYNFVSAARLGLNTAMTWLDGTRIPATTLLLDHILPLAQQGLAHAGIDTGDIDRYLNIIRERVASQHTGSQWMLHSLNSMKREGGSRSDRLTAVVSSMIEQQQEGQPVHMWPPARLERHTSMRNMQKTRVEHFMSTDLFTVNENELVELVACLMDWRRIRHVVVEDLEHRLVGLVSHRNLIRYLSRYQSQEEDGVGTPVKEIMITKPISVAPETLTADALALMRQHKVSALPVVSEGQLLGMITEYDFMKIADELLEDSMQRPAEAPLVAASSEAMPAGDGEPSPALPEDLNVDHPED